jgi:Iap family predicted aminopeptidase
MSHIALSAIVTTAVHQDLSDWVATMSKALSILQLHKSRNENIENTGTTSHALTNDQKRGRELYLFAEKNERKSQAAQIYANIGLACLGIRRLLQASYSFFDYHSLLIMS